MMNTEERRVLNKGSSSSSSLPGDETTSSLRRSSSARQKQEVAESSQARRLVRNGSHSSGTQASTAVQVGSIGPVFSLISQEDRSGPLKPRSQRQQQPAQLRSKSVSWKDPRMYLQRLGSIRAPLFNQSRATRNFPHQPRAFLHRKEPSPEHKKPSAWARLLRKLGFDGGKKVHAARADWLNYDAQSYAMNFEKDREAQYSSSSQQMPKISGPGAREIVTVLLQRSSSQYRNSGSILIPKPVPHNSAKTEMTTPLWKRRSVQAPSSLDLNRFRTTTTSRARRGPSM